MKQRKITMICGRYRGVLVYDPVTINDILGSTPHARSEKSKVTTEARKRINDKNKCKRLEILLYGNFTAHDYFITLTYDEQHTPANKKEARENLRKFFKQLRTTRSRRRQLLKYVYTTEGKHGESRIHHHVIINAAGKNDIEDIISLWQYCATQGVDVERLVSGAHDMSERAKYLTKEDKANGEQSYTGSRNLTRIETAGSWIEEDETITIPKGAELLRAEEKRNTYGYFKYIEYLLPLQQTAAQSKRAGNKKSSA